MPKKVLVVDDEQDVAVFLRTALQKNGYEVVIANDGVEGLALARREKPDLITLDLMMPRQTGTDMYRQLTKNKELGDIPIIVISGLSGRHLAVSRPFAVFDKPIDPDRFIQTVRKAIGEAGTD